MARSAKQRDKKPTTKRKPGRPRKIASVESFNRRANAYFNKCERDKRLPFVTGLALALGLSSRQSLMEYENRPEFSDAVKRAKLRCEHELVERTAAGFIPVAFGIFALKNHGWSDRLDVLQTHRVEDQTGVLQVPLEQSAEEWEAEYGAPVEPADPQTGAVN